MKRSAEISDCGRYRWWLRRDWSGMFAKSDLVTFIMLNPSTADASIDDPTIRRCIGFAKRWGFNAISVRNLFAFRATKPTELLVADNPTGGERGDSELLAASTSPLIVAAWGEKVPFERDMQAIDLLATSKLWCLGRCKNGKPRHPLYVASDTELELFKP